MAKGDPTQQQANQAPKMDQYSVMHRIMDNFNSSSPSQMPQMNNASNEQMGTMPMPRNNGVDLSAGNGGGFTGGMLPGNQFNPQQQIMPSPKPFGQYQNDFSPRNPDGSMQQLTLGGQSSSIAPSDPTTIGRRLMTGNRTFGM